MALVAVNGNNIPAQLKVIPHWVCWQYENRSGIATKVPLLPCGDGKRASVSDPKTWSDYDIAVGAFEAGQGDGVGFVVTKSVGICGIDLDHCVDRLTGEVEARAMGIVERLNSYSERTPSGEGIRVFVKGNLHTVDVMLNGSADHVVRASKRAIDAAAEGGRFILSTGDQCGRDTPDENLFAMVETARTYGKY